MNRLYESKLIWIIVPDTSVAAFLLPRSFDPASQTFRIGRSDQELGAVELLDQRRVQSAQKAKMFVAASLSLPIFYHFLP